MPTGIYPRKYRPAPDPRPRFLAFVPDRPADGCWLWRGHTSKEYGRFWLNGAAVPAHRVSYLLYVDASLLPSSLVLHRCDVPLCVRPDHLWAGTQSDNIRDAVAKGRWRQATLPKPKMRGEANPHARLTEAQVREIRRLYVAGTAPHQSGVSLRGLAAQFQVSKYAIYSIVHRLTWGHLSDSVTVVLGAPSASVFSSICGED
jgi:hypothetical protein